MVYGPGLWMVMVIPLSLSLVIPDHGYFKSLLYIGSLTIPITQYGTHDQYLDHWGHWGHWGHDFVNSDFEIFLLLVGNSWWCTWHSRNQPFLFFFIAAMILALISFHVLFSFNHLSSSSIPLLKFIWTSVHFLALLLTEPSGMWHPSCTLVAEFLTQGIGWKRRTRVSWKARRPGVSSWSEEPWNIVWYFEGRSY